MIQVSQVEQLLEQEEIYDKVTQLCNLHKYPTLSLEIYTINTDGAGVLIKPSSENAKYDLQAAEDIYQYIISNNLPARKEDRNIYISTMDFVELFV